VNPHRILLVDDDETLSALVLERLQKEGYSVLHATDGGRALDAFATGRVDLIVLDVNLPDMSGYEVCRRLRKTGEGVPIVFLSVEGEVDDRLRGFEVGASDYLPKPFDMDELLHRIRARIREMEARADGTPLDEPYRFGGNEVNFKTYYAKGTQGTQQLTEKQCQLLRYLVDHANQVVSREELLRDVWGYQRPPVTRTVDNFILQLREIFEADRARPRYFQTVRGGGYRFVPGETEAAATHGG
jgi:DNA-binding response OmpR family regulator